MEKPIGATEFGMFLALQPFWMQPPKSTPRADVASVMTS
jgi:hypothetical protein